MQCVLLLAVSSSADSPFRLPRSAGPHADEDAVASHEVMIERSWLDDKIINPAEARFAELLARKAEKMKKSTSERMQAHGQLRLAIKHAVALG